MERDRKWCVFRCVMMSHSSVSSSSSSAQSFRDQHHLAQCHCRTMDDGTPLRCSPARVPNPDSTCRTASSSDSYSGGGFHTCADRVTGITPEVGKLDWSLHKHRNEEIAAWYYIRNFHRDCRVPLSKCGEDDVWLICWKRILGESVCRFTVICIIWVPQQAAEKHWSNKSLLCVPPLSKAAHLQPPSRGPRCFSSLSRGLRSACWSGSF